MVLLAGSLMKRGGIRLTTWQLRYFTLTTTSLNWASAANGDATIGCITLSPEITATLIQREVGGEMACFKVEDPGRRDGKRVREFACASRNECTRWVAAINLAVTGLAFIKPPKSPSPTTPTPETLTGLSSPTTTSPTTTTVSPSTVSPSTHVLSPQAQVLITATPGAEAKLTQLRADHPTRHPDELSRFAASTASFPDHLLWEAAYTVKAATFTYPPNMPLAVYAKGGVAVDGTNVFFVQGALFDPAAADNDTWAHHAATVMKSVYEEESDMALTTVFLDIRTDEAFANPAVTALLPLFKVLLALINEHNPNRLKSLVIYPVSPMISWTISNLLRMVCDSSTRAKVMLVKGSDTSGSPAPMELEGLVKFEELPVETRRMHKVGGYREAEDDNTTM